MTEGLTYRDLAAHDLDALHAIMSDWQVVRQLGSWPWPADLAFTAARCRPFPAARGFIWGCFRAGRLVGTVGVSDGALGYCLERASWGQGLMTRAATDALDVAFAAGLSAVGAVVWADNAASARVLDKLGFVVTGRTLEMSRARGVHTPCVALRLTRARWDALRSPRRCSIAGA
ncbi:MAG: GNAT family N-acetyltransferase [Limimaricola sp.]|uniref:GNAT family N-acetyltransferase n=1 Tax=Limimaricola sp. TaxID=2211665 RepID=UPI001DC00F09|nr:GNAT family N-acetyltransferase [Limimaricola sp.]MBI1417984.1 GNAT family N-acetyltransferase [Limimaricola sp.]